MTSVRPLFQPASQSLISNDKPIDHFGIGRVGFAQAGKDIDFLPDHSQIVLGRSLWNAGELLPSSYHLRGEGQSVDICGLGHEATIAEWAGLVNPAGMSLLARYLAIAGILGIVLSLVLIVRPLFGW